MHFKHLLIVVPSMFVVGCVHVSAPAPTAPIASIASIAPKTPVADTAASVARMDVRDAADFARYPKVDADTRQIDFRVLDAHAMLGSRRYALDARDRPVITALGRDTYQLDLPLRRSSRSSLRGDETITTHFYYDGVELIFFGDKNRNQRYDRHESGVRHIIDHTRELVTQGNKRYVQPRTLLVTLTNKHISSSQRVATLEMRLVFLAERESSRRN